MATRSTNTAAEQLEAIVGTLAKIKLAEDSDDVLPLVIGIETMIRDFKLGRNQEIAGAMTDPNAQMMPGAAPPGPPGGAPMAPGGLAGMAMNSPAGGAAMPGNLPGGGATAPQAPPIDEIRRMLG